MDFVGQKHGRRAIQFQQFDVTDRFCPKSTLPTVHVGFDREMR